MTGRRNAEAYSGDVSLPKDFSIGQNVDQRMKRSSLLVRMLRCIVTRLQGMYMARCAEDLATLLLSAHERPLHPGIGVDVFEGGAHLWVYFEHTADDMPCLA